MEITTIPLNGYYTLIAATLVLLLGRIMVKKIAFYVTSTFPSLWQAVWLPL